MRYAGKLFHLGIGRAFKRQKVLMVIADNHVITSLAETGEVITEHYIDTARDYQRPYPVSYTHLTLPTNREV